jgi:hypothetical protein
VRGALNALDLCRDRCLSALVQRDLLDEEVTHHDHREERRAVLKGDVPTPIIKG